MNRILTGLSIAVGFVIATGVPANACGGMVTGPAVTSTGPVQVAPKTPDMGRMFLPPVVVPTDVIRRNVNRGSRVVDHSVDPNPGCRVQDQSVDPNPGCRVQDQSVDPNPGSRVQDQPDELRGDDLVCFDNPGDAEASDPAPDLHPEKMDVPQDGNKLNPDKSLTKTNTIKDEDGKTTTTSTTTTVDQKVTTTIYETTPMDGGESCMTKTTTYPDGSVEKTEVLNMKNGQTVKHEYRDGSSDSSTTTSDGMGGTTTNSTAVDKNGKETKTTSSVDKDGNKTSQTTVSEKINDQISTTVTDVNEDADGSKTITSSDSKGNSSVEHQQNGKQIDKISLDKNGNGSGENQSGKWTVITQPDGSIRVEVIQGNGTGHATTYEKGTTITAAAPTSGAPYTAIPPGASK